MNTNVEFQMVCHDCGSLTIKIENSEGASRNTNASDTVPKMRVTGAGAHTASSPSLTQGGSRVREFCTHGSGRGAHFAGPDQTPAFDNASTQVGCPDRRIDRHQGIPATASSAALSYFPNLQTARCEYADLWP
jgi:hypothetical protein